MRLFGKKSDKPPKKQTPHHYVFAHRAMRQLAFGDPYGFFTVMASSHRQEFLDDLWKDICQNCDKDGYASFTVKDIAIQITRVGEYPTILVVMPKPHFTAEAHMVCIVLKIPDDNLEQTPDKPEIRYFTLEKGTDFETGADRTVLCEWTESSHTNYGDGPEATSASFLAIVEMFMEAYRKDADRTLNR